MLQLSRRMAQQVAEPFPMEEHGDDYINLKSIFAAIRRQSRIIIGGTLVGIVLGVIYVATSVPLYTATTSIVIDRRQVRAVQDVSAVTDLGIDAPIVADSQVEVMKSETIALAVVNKLDLVNNATFQAPQGWLLTWVVQWLGDTTRDIIAWVTGPTENIQTDPAQAEAAQRWGAVYRLLSKITVARVGKTYVITVSYTGSDAKQAVQIADAYVDAYLTEQLDAKYEATRRANTWLEARLAELRQQSVDSDLAVQKFRAANNLIAVGGQLVSELQLSELNAQLSVARGDVARTSARLDRIRTVLSSGQTEMQVGEAITNPTVSELQVRLMDASRREAEIVSRFGPEHERAVQYKLEKSDIQRQILSELSRIAESYESDYQIAKSRLETLDKSVSKLIDNAADANNRLVQLRELERAADTYRSLYQSFMERYQQTVQQQSFPIGDARIVTPAVPPMSPSHPKTIPILILSAFLGAIAGGACGAIRERRDDTIRTAVQVREKLGLSCVGLLPKIFPARLSSTWGSWMTPNTSAEPKRNRLPDLLRFAIDVPQSEFAEAMRSIAATVIHRHSGNSAKVLTVLSVEPQAGRTLLATNLAAVLANAGKTCLLIDGDIGNPTLSKTLVPDAETGLLEVLAEGKAWRSALHVVPGSTFLLLPTVSRPDLIHSNQLIARERFEEILCEARDAFDYVIVDTPPLSVSSDARVLASMVESALLVVDWGRTRADFIRETLLGIDMGELPWIGVVLNRVDLKSLRWY
ncbi:GNVR domain-containing protein [Microvirga calopogonii]|uniref:GNVR domain-containing protein n=1 Tax=Microvirga calopogonii TaxID=2078013 RepID=UPI000E0CF5C6|nr:GNVR domain-containing protein [Microvirga calopogonii]